MIWEQVAGGKDVGFRLESAFHIDLFQSLELRLSEGLGSIRLILRQLFVGLLQTRYGLYNFRAG